MEYTDYTGRKTDANLWAGGAPAAGCIFFHEQELEFSSRRYSLSADRQRICYDDIASIAYCRILGIMPNGIRLILRDGRQYVFAVNHRRDVGAFLCRKAGLQP